jgi:hypothetical protein
VASHGRIRTIELGAQRLKSAGVVKHAMMKLSEEDIAVAFFAN